LETLFAVIILMIAITVTFSTTQSNLSYSFATRDQAIATNLAEEALEYIRNVRDSNAIAGQNWIDDPPSGSPDIAAKLFNCLDKVCYVDIRQRKITECSPGGCPPIRAKSNGFYGYNSSSEWSNTRFVRSVTVSKIANREIAVAVNVAWNSGTIQRRFTLSEHLFDWKF